MALVESTSARAARPRLHGGYSSVAEHQVVALGAVGSNPTSHPNPSILELAEAGSDEFDFRVPWGLQSAPVNRIYSMSPER